MLATAEEQHVGPMLWHPAFGGGGIGDNRKRALGGASSVINLILADLKLPHTSDAALLYLCMCVFIYLFFKGKKTSKYHRAHSLLFRRGGWWGVAKMNAKGIF